MEVSVFMIKIGLTGGIGSGKSTISNIIKNNKIPVIDADIISRTVLNKYPEIMNGIKLNFGKKFFDEYGNIKRRELGNFIFQDKDRKCKYEGIIMPYIKNDILSEMKKFSMQGNELCVLDAATLIENNFQKYVDDVILVWVNKNIQIERVKKRDNLTSEQVIMRINSQMLLDEKKKYADFILDNSNDIASTKDNLKIIFEKIITKHRGVKCLKEVYLGHTQH